MDQRNTIYLDIEDDITAIIGKLKAADSKQVALVIPKRSSVFQSAVNLKLLKKMSSAQGKEPVLITEDGIIHQIAGQLGVLVASTLKAEAKVPSVTQKPAPDLPSDIIEGESLDKPMTPVKEAEIAAAASAAAAAVDIGKSTAAAADAASTAASQPPAKSRKRIPDFDRFKKRFSLGLLGLLGFILLIWWMFFSLPRASIVIHGNTQNLDLELAFTADTKATHLDSANAVLPATKQTLDKTLTQDITPTGKKDASTKATGTIVVENCQTPDGPIGYPSGTQFTADSGKIFVSDDGFDVPGKGGSCASSDPVPVTAAQSGEESNLPASPDTTYTSDTFPGDYHLSGSAMTGGSNKTLKIVSQADLDNAKSDLLKNAKTAAQTELASQFEDSDYVLADSFTSTTKSATSNPEVGKEAGASATVTLKVTYSELAVKKADLSTLLKKQAISESKPAGGQSLGVVNDGLDQASVTINGKPIGTAQHYDLVTTVVLGPDIDLESLRQQLSGKKSGEAELLIRSFPNVTSVDVHLSPFWVRSIPSNPAKINLSIDVPQ